LLCFLLR